MEDQEELRTSAPAPDTVRTADTQAVPPVQGLTAEERRRRNEERRSDLLQRSITAAGLIAMLVILMYFGGAVMSIAVMVCISFAIWEEFNAFKQSGHAVVSWPTWAGIVLGVPLTLTSGNKVLLPVMMAILLITLAVIVFRKGARPKLDDAVMSMLPLCSVALPGLCIVALSNVEPKGVQMVLLSLVFAIPVLCDTFAYFVGTKVGGPKMCPEISPHKTFSGAIGGMAGAVLAALFIRLLAGWCLPADQLALCPSGWMCLLLGLLGGVAGQLGDLFASMVKRSCGIKDFSNLFPGHGGMLDRLDSILFTAVILFCYRLLSTI